MKPESIRSKLRSAQLIISMAMVTVAVSLAQGQTNSVTAGDTFNYTINGQADPSFTFQRGVTYVFLLSNLNGFPPHPFWIKSALGLGSATAYNSGVINNGAASGSVTFSVPASAPNQLFYQCGNHPSMSGTLAIIDPPAPPTVKIVFINVADFITIKSTGTNGWSAMPEYNCTAAASNWTGVPHFTNNFANNTNTTTFNRLDAICGSAPTFLRIRNAKN